MKSFLVVSSVLLTIGLAFDLPSLNIPKPLLEQEEPTGRITNGQSAAPNQFPYQVGLSFTDGVLNYFCGGSLISAEWVLTVAHCTVGMQRVTVRLGSVSRSNPAISFMVDKSHFTIHAGFIRSPLTNDIALIRIPLVQFTNAIQVVKLPSIASSYPTYIGDAAIVSGWGLTSDASHSFPNDLQYATGLTVISNTECAKTFSIKSINDGIICVVAPSATSTCGGDSGGPLVLEASGIQIGITSFSAADGCEKGFPFGFTRVTAFLDWIEENSGMTLGMN